MTKQVSPAFAVIVIVVALALGALYFMVRYRQHEAREDALAQAAQQQKEAMIRSGRYGQGMQTRRSGSSPRRSGAPGAEAPETAPGAQPEPAPETAEE